jgi:hypothetical protein
MDIPTNPGAVALGCLLIWGFLCGIAATLIVLAVLRVI